MRYDNFTKEAGFAEGFLKEVVDKVGFREKPFETIFGILGTAVIWKMSKVLGIVSFAAESLGYGPGLLGRAIDKALRGGGAKTVSDMNLSDSNLKSASQFAIEDLFSKTAESTKTSSSEMFLRDMCMMKKTINSDDIVVASLVGKYFPMQKEARTGRAGMFRRFLSSVFGGRKLGLANVLYGILKLFATGLIGLGIAGGVKSVIKDVKRDTTDPTGVGPTSFTNVTGGHYKNVSGNVQETIVKLLNTIKFDSGNFETTFSKEYGKPLRNSQRMRKLLSMVRSMNGGEDIYEMNGWGAFRAPSVKAMANILMPEFKYEKDKSGK